MKPEHVRRVDTGPRKRQAGRAPIREPHFPGLEIWHRCLRDEFVHPGSVRSANQEDGDWRRASEPVLRKAAEELIGARRGLRVLGHREDGAVEVGDADRLEALQVAPDMVLVAHDREVGH